MGRVVVPRRLSQPPLSTPVRLSLNGHLLVLDAADDLELARLLDAEHVEVHVADEHQGTAWQIRVTGDAVAVLAHTRHGGSPVVRFQVRSGQVEGIRFPT